MACDVHTYTGMLYRYTIKDGHKRSRDMVPRMVKMTGRKSARLEARALESFHAALGRETPGGFGACAWLESVDRFGCVTTLEQWTGRVTRSEGPACGPVAGVWTREKDGVTIAVGG